MIQKMRLTQEKKEDTGQQPPTLHYQKDFGYDPSARAQGEGKAGIP